MGSPAFKTMSSHASWEWPTPKKFYEQLNAEFHFDFDPCPIGGEVDGRSTLFVSWKGKRVFCNPPYGPQIPKFIARAMEAELAVFLVPARTDTRWFHDICLPFAREIRFIRGRLRFGDGKNPAPFPSMVVVFDAQYSRTEQMRQECLDYQVQDKGPDKVGALTGEVDALVELDLLKKRTS